MKGEYGKRMCLRMNSCYSVVHAYTSCSFLLLSAEGVKSRCELLSSAFLTTPLQNWKDFLRYSSSSGCSCYRPWIWIEWIARKTGWVLLFFSEGEREEEKLWKSCSHSTTVHAFTQVWALWVQVVWPPSLVLAAVCPAIESSVNDHWYSPSLSPVSYTHLTLPTTAEV